MDQALKQKIRTLVSTVYDLQKLRIQMGNRLVQAFNQELGQTPGTKQEDLSPDQEKLIKNLRKEFRRITDEYVTKKDIIRGIAEDPAIVEIKDMQDYLLVQQYENFLENEEDMKKVLEGYVKDHPLWNGFLKDVKGCGHLMGGVIIAYLDPYKARHVSSFWKYCGMDTVVISDDKGNYIVEGRRKKMTHMEEYDYIDKEGKPAKKMGLPYNPFVKTKLLGVLGSSFLKLDRTYPTDEHGEYYYDPVMKNGKPVMKDGNAVLKKRSIPGKYAKIYYDQRVRYDNHPKHMDKQDAHKHSMANRYMVKQFVRDLWVAWREIENLPISKPYEEAKLGMAPHEYNNNHSIKADQYPVIEDKAM